MKKIEIIHGSTFSSVLDTLVKQKLIDGFTSLAIHSGNGPLKGAYDGDHLTDDQYLSLILHDGETEELYKEIKRLYPARKLLMFESDIVNKSFK